jgi:ferric-dicitrate binding protein FerR (iron transport regulator)
MTKEEFQDLLLRYRKGDCSVEEIQKINEWFVKISNKNLELSEAEKEQVSERILSSVQHAFPFQVEEKKTNANRFLILKIAASFLAIFLVGYFFAPRAPGPPSKDLVQTPNSTDLIEYKNITQNIAKIQLPDSSIVQLKPDAQISYLKKWDDQKREVHLVGEAFFEVTKDSSRPFYVYGGEIVTKVLGTSFSVKAAMDSECIEVSVHTGKVSVYEDAPQNNLLPRGSDVSGVILSPNEKVEFFVNDKHWVTSLVEEPRPLPASNKAVELVFSSTPMSEIIKSIERTYSIGVILENEASYSCTFTGDVSMMELYDMLDVICKSTGTNYEVKGTKILITGRGCE